MSSVVAQMVGVAQTVHVPTVCSFQIHRWPFPKPLASAVRWINRGRSRRAIGSSGIWQLLGGKKGPISQQGEGEAGWRRLLWGVWRQERRWKEGMGVLKFGPRCGSRGCCGWTCALCVPRGGIPRWRVALCFADPHPADPQPLALQYPLLEHAQPGRSAQSCKVARC